MIRLGVFYNLLLIYEVVFQKVLVGLLVFFQSKLLFFFLLSMIVLEYRLL